MCRHNTMPPTLNMSLHAGKGSKKAPELLNTLLQRVSAIEETLMRLKDVHVVNAGGPKSIDMTAFASQRDKSIMLQSLYPSKEDGNVHALGEFEFGPNCSGYWPSQRQWLGMYLGGCEQGSEERRGVTIPLCLKANLAFYSPQGLGTSSAGDNMQRFEAMSNCSSAIVDFTCDERCLNYVAGL